MYDVAPDGRRFLAYRNVDETVAERLEPRVVINWFDELDRLIAEGS